MSTRAVVVLLAVLLLGGGALALWLFLPDGPRWPWQDTYEVVRTDYHPPEPKAPDVLTDDKLEDKPREAILRALRE
jgi:hypothetical protein